MRVEPVWSLSDLPRERLEEITYRATNELCRLRGEKQLNLLVTVGVVGIFAGAGLAVLAFGLVASLR